MEHKQITFEEYIEMYERCLPAHFENFLSGEKENFCDIAGITNLDGYFIEINCIHISFDAYEIDRCDEYDEVFLYAGNTLIASLLAEDFMAIDHFTEYMEKQYKAWKEA